MLGINAIQITPEVLRQISDIDEFKGLWKGLERHTTGLQLLGDVADYGAKFQTVLGPLREQPISSDMIRILHATEMKKQDTHYPDISDFKSVPSQLIIQSDDQVVGQLDTAEPEHVKPLLDKLCQWVNVELSSDGTLHPLIVAAVFTAVYLQISPFETGNLRVARFLIMLILIKAGYVYAPYVSMVSNMNEKASAVYHALQHNQKSLEEGRADWSQWLGCFLMLLQDQKDVLYDRLYGKETELQNLPALSARIMALFKDHQRLKMKEIIKLTNGRRATIKLRLGELIDGGYLRRHGTGRGTWYSLV